MVIAWNNAMQQAASKSQWLTTSIHFLFTSLLVLCGSAEPCWAWLGSTPDREFDSGLLYLSLVIQGRFLSWQIAKVKEKRKSQHTANTFQPSAYVMSIHILIAKVTQLSQIYQVFYCQLIWAWTTFPRNPLYEWFHVKGICVRFRR